MNLKEKPLTFNESDTQLEKNISRLVKLEGDSGRPGKKFTDSLVDSALSKLKNVGIGAKRERGYTIFQIPWMNRAAGWAAMFIAACCAGLAVVLSTLLSISTLFGVLIFITMFSNWLIYFGGLIS